jgi:DNA-binding response OmpR family regulator
MSIQHPTCPLCGGIIAEDGRVLVDMDAGLVVSGHQVAQLTRTEFETFSALWRNRPRTLSKEVLLAASADIGHDDDRELKLVDVMIHKLRKKLQPLGVEIGTAWGEGYRIEQRSKMTVPA